MRTVVTKKKASLKSSVSALSNERIGVLGGTFNPIHSGHLNSALTVREVLELDRVLMVPAYNPPHRQLVGPEPEDRLALLKAAVKPYEPELSIDDQEIDRRGTSYSVETLRELNKSHKAENIYFIMGADAFMDFPHWKNFEELLSLANFVVTTRPGAPLSLSAVDLPSGLEQFVKASDQNHVVLSSGRSIIRVDLDDIDISSTELRKKLRNGQSVQKWMPEKVLDIVNERGLYKRSSPLVSDYREFAILVDFGAVVIHVFQDVVRQQYHIEDLWRSCPQIQREVDPRLTIKPGLVRGEARQGKQ
jgi:nicotinate-nucleotide adenylyltransferase